MKIRTAWLFVILAILMVACATAGNPPAAYEQAAPATERSTVSEPEVAAPATERSTVSEPEVAAPATERSTAFDNPNSCFHMTMNDVVSTIGGDWQFYSTGKGYDSAHKPDFDTGVMFTIYGEGGPDTRVDAIGFLWDMSFDDIDGTGGGMTYDFLDACNLNPMPILDAMKSCSASEERSSAGCIRDLPDGFKMMSSLDSDLIYVVMVMDWQE